MVLLSAYVSVVRSGRGDICHLNAENQGSSQVSGSSRSSGMQIGISPCRYSAGSPWYACTLRAYALVPYAYLIYHFMRRYGSKGFSFLLLFSSRLDGLFNGTAVCPCWYTLLYAYCALRYDRMGASFREVYTEWRISSMFRYSTWHRRFGWIIFRLVGYICNAISFYYFELPCSTFYRFAFVWQFIVHRSIFNGANLMLNSEKYLLLRVH